jgi:hypothetical protein
MARLPRQDERATELANLIEQSFAATTVTDKLIEERLRKGYEAVARIKPPSSCRLEHGEFVSAMADYRLCAHEYFMAKGRDDADAALYAGRRFNASKVVVDGYRSRFQGQLRGD